jgi:hypothetical protein
VIVVICTAIAGILMAVLVYVWMVDYCLKEVRVINSIANIGKRPRPRNMTGSVRGYSQPVERRVEATEATIMGLSRSTTNHQMRVYPELLVANIE